MNSPEHAPRISVIIPVYNGGENFQRGLDALRASNPVPHEIIVVDDGSSDQSSSLARERGLTVLSTARARSGPAVARNIGAQAATGDVVLFVDADIAVHSDVIGRMAHNFESDPDLAACFGSYDAQPAAKNFLSQYKNLFHHYVHQSAHNDASTFWAGCGAVRREVFLKVGGFSEAYPRPSIEDIELGYRLKAAGSKLQLDKEIQCQHLKRWTWRSLLRSDILDRGVPWTELILRDGAFVNDLNLQTHNRISVVAIYLLLLSLALGLVQALGWLASIGLAIGLLWLNRNVYAFFKAQRGISFALCVIPVHWLYYFYNGLSFSIGAVRHFFTAKQSAKRLPRWLIFIASLIITLLPVPYVISNWQPMGDEPHYLLTAHSLVRDGDLDLANNYANGDYRAFFNDLLDEHIRIGADGRSYLSHDLGLPILITPAYALGGRAGVIIFLTIIAALIGVNIYALAYDVTGNTIAAATTWVLLLITPVLSLYAYLVYPEMIGALIVLWIVRQLFTPHASRLTPHIIISLGLALLPWLSTRFIPIALFLLAWKIWRDKKQRGLLLLPIGLLAISLIGYFAANAFLSGGQARAIDLNANPIAMGFQGISIERMARGLIGWWLDQQRGLLIYSPVYLIALIGLPVLWRRFKWNSLALMLPLLIAYLSTTAWGGFWIGWEISARYMVVGLPLLAAPFAVALHQLRGKFFWGLLIFTALISIFNNIVIIRIPGVWAYRESIVALYDRYIPIDLWRVLPAISGGATIEPPDRSVWRSPIGASSTLVQSSSFENLTIGVYDMTFEAHADKISATDAPLLTIDLSTGDGVNLLHRVLTSANFSSDTPFQSFSIPFDQPFYNKWTYPLYLQITSSGLAEVEMKIINITPQPLHLWGVSGFWLAVIALIVVATNRHSSVHT